jgi:hypothetical protein
MEVPAEAFDIVINGVSRYLADLEVSAVASAGFSRRTSLSIRCKFERARTGLYAQS